MASPKIEFKNPKGQIAGYVEGDYYITSRSVKDGQIYRIKHTFGGKYFKLPIGIQKSILDRLKRMNVKYVRVLIIGIEKFSYTTQTKVDDIYKEGVLIKEDRGGKTCRWGWQYIWDIAYKKVDRKQQTLI